MRSLVFENIVKNVILVLILLPAYFNIQSFLTNSNFTTDKAVLGSLLTAVSILIVTACFGNFAFTYEKIKSDNLYSRLLAHFTTGLLMLLIGLSLEITSVLYDFWDLNRLG